ncbi:hypothetical protein RJ639_005841 [Escallonia herrerae]|uniref:Uncharacterized protein n=1 Tax=Escallonia herrerae TaxID=1293975 RepID=A0AA89AV80_9ASTE|nr:hypothetical protein RJ639_005841 [Escallonia herrerae]
MVRPAPTHVGEHLGSIPLAICLFVSVSAIVTLCAKHARRSSKEFVAETDTKTDRETSKRKLAPLPSPRKFVTTISNRAISPFTYHKKAGDHVEVEDTAEGGFGEGGLWQKSILMGEKCQPPEFSGVIYYDPFGNRISELPPRSPRASPLPSFSFHVARDAV